MEESGPSSFFTNRTLAREYHQLAEIDDSVRLANKFCHRSSSRTYVSWRHSPSTAGTSYIRRSY